MDTIQMDQNQLNDALYEKWPESSRNTGRS